MVIERVVMNAAGGSCKERGKVRDVNDKERKKLHHSGLEVCKYDFLAFYILHILVILKFSTFVKPAHSLIIK